jgi:hypothetical protein
MSNSISRPKATWTRLGVGKTFGETNLELHDTADPWVPNTNDTVPRLRPLKLGERVKAFFDDEIDGLIEALRRFRDQQPVTPDSERDNEAPPPTGQPRSTARRPRPAESGARR